MNSFLDSIEDFSYYKVENQLSLLSINDEENNFTPFFSFHNSHSTFKDDESDNEEEQLYFHNQNNENNNILRPEINEEKSEKKTQIEHSNTTIKTPQNFDPKEKSKNLEEKKEQKDLNEKKLGRKKLKENEEPNENNEEEEENEGYHGKRKEDNIMRKIKTNIINFILNILNSNLKNKNFKFLQISKEIIENLKRDDNINLMNRKLKDIFYNEPIRSKYKRNNYDNKFLIDKILQENKEKEIIKILNKTYYDMVLYIREIKLEAFLDKIIKKENKMKKKQNTKEYIDLLKGLLFRYKEWFVMKKGRNKRKNKMKKNK